MSMDFDYKPQPEQEGKHSYITTLLLAFFLGDIGIHRFYTGYVGSGNSSGTYFVGLEYKWLNEYYKIGKIEFVNKMTYSELVDAIN